MNPIRSRRVREPRCQPESEALAVELGSSLTLVDLGDLLNRLRSQGGSGRRWCLNAGDLEQVDCAGVQLLCALAKDLETQGIPLTWRGVSPVLREAVGQLGLGQALGWS